MNILLHMADKNLDTLSVQLWLLALMRSAEHSLQGEKT